MLLLFVSSVLYHNLCLAGTSFVTTDLENLPQSMESLQGMSLHFTLLWAILVVL
jgi:hypothetical protein